MNSKNRYIRELEKKISRLPKDEQHEAIGYYMEYLVDSNVDTYDEAVALLGTPNNVAAKLVSEQYLRASDREPAPFGEVERPKNEKWKIILAIIASIFAIPIAVPLAIVLVLVVLCFIFALLLFLATFLLMAIVLLIGGIATLILAISTVSTHLLTAGYYFGGSLFLLGMGVLVFQLSQFLAKKTFDLFRFIANKFLQKGAKAHV